MSDGITNRYDKPTLKYENIYRRQFVHHQKKKIDLQKRDIKISEEMIMKISRKAKEINPHGENKSHKKGKTRSTRRENNIIKQ